MTDKNKQKPNEVTLFQYVLQDGNRVQMVRLEDHLTVKHQLDAVKKQLGLTESHRVRLLMTDIERLKEENQLHSNLVYDRGQEIAKLKSANEFMKVALKQDLIVFNHIKSGESPNGIGDVMSHEELASNHVVLIQNVLKSVEKICSKA